MVAKQKTLEPNTTYEVLVFSDIAALHLRGWVKNIPYDT